jgi:Caspase domain
MATTIAVLRRHGSDFRGASALVAHVVVSLLLAQSAAAQTRVVQTSGTGEVGSDSLVARERACANGTRLAVERAIESLLDPGSIKANRRGIDEMLTGASRYAQRTEILQEGPVDKEYRCRVRVTVDTGLLTRDLKESSIVSSRTLGPRMMVILDEYRLDRPVLQPTRTAVETPAAGNAPASSQAPDSEFLIKYKEQFPDLPPVKNGSAAAAFLKALRDRDYQVVDEEYARTIREQRIGVMRDFISNSLRVGALAKDLGATRNVRWLILGGTKAVGREPSGKRFVADAVMVVRIVDTSTGEIIASEEGTKSIEETSHDTALSEAAAAVARALGDRLAIQMSEYQTQRAGLGTRMLVNLFKVPNAQTALSFQAYLESLPGMTEVEQLNFDGTNGLLELNVAFHGGAADLSRLVFEQQSRQPEFSKLRLQQSGGAALDFVYLPSTVAASPPVEVNNVLKPADPPYAAPPQPVKRRLFVLAVGVSEYQDPRNNLANPANDAQRIGDFFAKQRGLELYQEVAVQSLLNEKANRKQLLEKLDWLSDTPRDGDVRILFLSGHGIIDRRRDYYFAGYGYNSLETVDHTSISWYDIFRRLNGAAGNTWLIVDTCHAGGVAGTKGLTDHEDLTEMLKRYGENSRRFVTLAASTSRETVPDDSVFFKALIKGLSEGQHPNKRYVDLADLADFVSKEVSEATKHQQHVISTGLENGGWPIALLPPDPRRR